MEKMKTSEEDIIFFLRYLADPGYVKGTGEELGVEQSTIAQVVVFGSTKLD